MTTTSGPAWWASAFGTIIDGAGAVWVPAGCYDLCTLFKADSDFGIAGWWCRILEGQKTLGVISLASKKQEIRDNRFPYEKINL